MDVIVYFDLDGVLADMEGGLMQNTELVGLRKILDDLIDTKFTEYKGLVDDDIKSKFKAELEQNPESPVKELKKAFNKYTSKVFSIAAKPGFYANLPLMEGAKEMVTKAKELTGKLPHILSSPVGDENDPTNPSVQEKKDWVKSNFGDMVDKIIITTDKASVVKDKCCLLIDDRPKYVNVFTAAGGSAILHKKSVDTISQMEQLVPKLSSMTENKKWVMTFESFRKSLSNRINENSENVDTKSNNYSELINVDEMSKEYGISSEEIKKCIDELQKKREESNEILKKEKGTGFAEMGSKGAQDSLLQLLVNKNILVKVKGLDSTILKNKGVKPGPDFGKLMKEFSEKMQNKKYMTPNNYQKEIDSFFKEKGY